VKTYEFTLILPEVDDQTADAIYGKCRDASLGKSNGASYVAFDRKAESLEAAIESAVADLRSIGVQPLHVQMDVPLVSS